MPETRMIRCPLSPEERTGKLEELQKSESNLANAETLRAAVRSEHNEIVRGHRASVRSLNELLESNSIERPIECDWIADEDRNVRKLIRLDTREIIEEKPLYVDPGQPKEQTALFDPTNRVPGDAEAVERLVSGVPPVEPEKKPGKKGRKPKPADAPESPGSGVSGPESASGGDPGSPGPAPADPGSPSPGDVSGDRADGKPGKKPGRTRKPRS